MSGATGGARSPFHFNSLEMREAEQAFRQAYPTFASTSALDDLRAREYARLDDLGQIYLDYTGGGLYAESQLREHFELLRHHVFGNPHSLNPTSRATTELVERARASVLDFFQASPDEYAVIFTSNASQALKLVGEAYPFQPGGQLLLLSDNHNSVNGIREFARAKGASFTYLPVMAPDLRMEEALLLPFLEHGPNVAQHLFAYPAQSNFTGVQHPLEWIEAAQARGWQVLLDGAAFVPTNRLDLSRWHPDFVPLSFYKMFGYPTGVGCLLARKAALATLQRPWFAGGTIALNFFDPHGSMIDERVVDLRASEIGLSLRTGCFCNPGAGEAAFHLSKETLRNVFHEESRDTLPQLFKGEGGMSWDQFLGDLGMQSGGAVRISLGLVTNFADVYRLVQFAQTFLDTFPGQSDLPPRLHC